MPDVAKRAPITELVLAAVAAASDLPVGDHDAPDDTSGGYSIVYALPGGVFDGSQGGPHEMATFAYQVDSYHRTRRACELLVDRNRAALLALRGSADGWHVMYVDQSGVGGVDNEGRDETNELALFCCHDDFAVQVTSGNAAVADYFGGSFD